MSPKPMIRSLLISLLVVDGSGCCLFRSTPAPKPCPTCPVQPPPVTLAPSPLPDCRVPAEQPEPDLSRAVKDPVARTVTLPYTVYAAYAAESLARLRRFEAVARCIAAAGGKVSDLPSTTPATLVTP